jgi:hypothetical protein
MEDWETEGTVFHQVERPLKVHVEKPDLLNSFSFVDCEAKEFAANEVEIQLDAWGVNFKDVFVALGQMKSSQTMVSEKRRRRRGRGFEFHVTVQSWRQCGSHAGDTLCKPNPSEWPFDPCNPRYVVVY